MSFETIIIGHVLFKKNVDEEKKKEIIDKVKRLCETNVIDVYTSAGAGTPVIEEIAVEYRNPSSHMDGNAFKALESYLRSNLDAVEYSAFKLFYTDSPHESFAIGGDGQ